MTMHDRINKANAVGRYHAGSMNGAYDARIRDVEGWTE
jgi:hypothetical protein